MVLDVTKLYPDYGFRTQPGDRPAFGSNSSELSGAVRDDLGSVTESLKYVKNKIDRFERGNRDAQTERVMDCAEGVLFAGGVMPTLRRINCLPKDLEEGNWERSALMAGVAAASLPGDWREVRGAWEQLGNGVKYALGDRSIALRREVMANRFQHPLSFIRGTFLNKALDLNKHGWLARADKTLYDTSFGKFIRKNLGISKPVQHLKTIGGIDIPGFRFHGNFFKELVGTALLRTNVIGLAISTAIEIPAIIKSAMVEGDSTDKAKSVTKQVCKSAGMIALVTGGISLVGAAAALLFPPAGTAVALLGMAVGSAAGVMASKELNKQIDNIFT